MSKTVESEPTHKQDSEPPKSEAENGNFFMENGIIFNGTKEAADRYADHIRSEAVTKQLNLEAATNKSSDRPIKSRQESTHDAYAEKVIREQGFTDHEFAALTAGWADRTAIGYETGDMKDEADAKEKGRLYRGVVDLLDSDSGAHINMDERVVKLQAQLDSYQKNKVPTKAVEWQLKVTLQAKEMMTEQKEDFENDAKAIAQGEAWTSHIGDAHGDIEIARTILADHVTSEHNEKLAKRRSETPQRKQEVIQTARAQAQRSYIDDIFDAVEASKRVSGEVVETPKQAEALIDTSPDLTLQLLAEADGYADEQIQTSSNPKIRERYEKERRRLDQISESFLQLSKLWQANGSGKTYAEFYEELSDDTTDRTVMGWLANAHPGVMNNNPLIANRKLAMIKRMSKSS